jgi:hypothetical protein
VDDIAAILLLAQTYGTRLIVVICDDATGVRFPNFMKKYGNAIQALYGCTFIPEAALSENIPPNTTVFVHAPATAATAAWLDSQKSNIARVFAQGEAYGRANFKNAPEMWALLNGPDLKGKSTFFLSNDTKFVINSSVMFGTDLHPLAQQLLEDYYSFKRIAQFGIPAGITPAADGLYSDDGGPPDFPGGPPTIGNGIKSKVPFINKLRREQKMPAQDSEELIRQLGVLDTALKNTYTGTNPTTTKNIRDVLWLLTNYCDYEKFLVDSPTGPKLPNMSNFKTIPPRREPCDPDVQRALEPDETTALFDAASACFGLNLVGAPRGPADNSHHPALRKIIRNSLKAFSDKLNGVPEAQIWKPTQRAEWAPSPYIPSPPAPPAPPAPPGPLGVLSAPGDWGVYTEPNAAMKNGGRRKSRRKRNRKRRSTRR